MENFKIGDLVECISSPEPLCYQINVDEKFHIYKVDNGSSDLISRHPSLHLAKGECFHKRHFELVKPIKYTTLLKGV